MVAWFWLGLAYGSPLESWDFETGPQSFDNDMGLQFEWGEFLEEPPPNGDCCGWATRLNSHYLNDAVDVLSFPSVDLGTAARPVLILEHWFAIEDGPEGDAAWIEARVEEEWLRLEPVYGYPSDSGFSGLSDTWQNDAFDLSGLGSTPQLRLRFFSGERVSYPGWQINTIELWDGDPIPPVIFDVYEPQDTSDVDGPYTVMASAIDDLTYPGLVLYWSANEGPISSVSMTPLGDSHFAGDIDGVPSGTTVSWWIVASDEENSSTFPNEGRASFHVSLPPPTELSGADLHGDNRIAASTINLTWESPEAVKPIQDFEIYRDGIEIFRTNDTQATVPLLQGQQIFEVYARYETSFGVIPGEASEPLMIHAAIPTIHLIDPDYGWPGDQMRVDLFGDHLYLSPDDLDLSVDQNIIVDSVDVIDANHARAILRIDEMAEPGTRLLKLTIGDTEEIYSPPFTVLSSENQPRVLAVKPPHVRQGAETTIFIDLVNGQIDSSIEPTVDLGEGVYVESVVRRSTGLDVKIVVSGNAPIGDHPITVDEGNRILTGSSLEVRDNRPSTQPGCSHTHRTSPFGLFFLAFFMALRRTERQDRTSQPLLQSNSKT